MTTFFQPFQSISKLHRKSTKKGENDKKFKLRYPHKERSIERIHDGNGALVYPAPRVMKSQAYAYCPIIGVPSVDLETSKH